MAEIVRMPKLSDTMTEGTVAKWHKKIGDKVKSGDLLAEIETDKATMEFESFQDGVLLHIGVQEKQAAPVDAILAILGKEGEDIKALLSGATSANNNSQPASNGTLQQNTTAASNKELPPGVEVVRMPKLSDTMTEGTIEKWHKKVGDKIKSGDLLADIATDKATMEFESFQDGVLIYRGIEEGQAVPVDAIIAILGKGGEDVNAILAAVNSTSKNTSQPAAKENKKEIVPSQQNSVSQPVLSTSSGGRIKASPLAKALAKEKGIDISRISGSGEGGRIVKADIINYKEVASSSTQSYATGVESFTDEPASQMRKTIARRLLESKNGAPHFYLTVDLDMDNAIAAREAINKLSDVKVSFNDLVIKACAVALRKHPRVNSSWMGDKIRLYNHIHIGVAVAVEDGLLVPVVRFADQKSISQISSEVKILGKRAKEKKLQPADWEGNTFTISNLGMFGIDSFTSIINSPESCILSVGAIRQVPVVKNGAVVPGNIMKVTLACDHRSVDGATGAAFLQTLKMFIENPVAMLL